MANHLLTASSISQYVHFLQTEERAPNVDEDGNTNTCKFLKPVADETILVDGKKVEGVTWTGDNGSYTYTVPVEDITTEDGMIKSLVFQVEWRSNGSGGYSDSELDDKMVLTTPCLRATSKKPFTVTGKVTGWIDPNCLGHENCRGILAGMMLENSPNTKAYLTGEVGLRVDEATQVMLQYMGTDEGKAATMERVTPVLDATEAKAYDPCVVTFDLNGGTSNETLGYKLRLGRNTPVIPNPTRDGYTFNGWSPALTETVTSNVTYVAQWHSHTYGDWTVTTPATCTEAGVETRTCTDEDCNHSETRSIAALGHDWREAWEQNEDGHWHICDRCGACSEAEAHTYPDTWTVRTPATTTAEGEEYHNCIACGHEETRRIAQLPVTSVTPPTVDPGTNIPDEEVPLANTVGLNNIDHFAYIAGYEDGAIRLTNNITRAEFATIAARFISNEITDDGVGDFSDTANHWAAKEIRLAAKVGWIVGDGNRFRPNDPITRAEVMVLVNRMLDRIPDADRMLPGMKTWSDNPTGTWYDAAVQEATSDHAYERAEDGATEIWTELTEAKDWTALEAEWAANNGASAPKEEA